MFKTILEKESQAEIVEKKSRFIANVFYIETVEEAEEKIKQIKKKYFDARHNCFAYSIFSKEKIIDRFSDDGEPSGTAGAPILNILNSKKLTNILVIVTRYFGGILLGTGGLVRAYTGATHEALNKTNIIYKELGIEAKFEINYQDLEKLKYYFKQNDIEIIKFEYGENVEVFANITNNKYQETINKISELNFKIINTNIICEKYINQKLEE